MSDQYIREDRVALKGAGGFDISFLESYCPGMKCYHMHSHYEISVILNGNVSVLLPEQISSGTEPRIVMLQPFTLHHMIPEPNQLYRRINIYFTKEYVEKLPGEWQEVRKVFTRNGGILLPDESQLRTLEQIFSVMEKEKDPKRNIFLLIYALSLLGDVRRTRESESEKFPEYIRQALIYFSEHFTEQITAEKLAKHLGIGRTKLMTGFRHCLGYTIHQYQQSLRLKYAEDLRKNGASVGEAAAASGFCDTGGYIRAYRRVYGTTPTGKE